LKKEKTEAKAEKPATLVKLEPTKPKESDTPRFKHVQAAFDRNPSKRDLSAPPTSLPPLDKNHSKSIKSSQFGDQPFEFTFSEQVQTALPAITGEKREEDPSLPQSNLPKVHKKLQDRLQVYNPYLNIQENRRKEKFSKSIEVRPRSDGERVNSRSSSKDLVNQRKIKITFKAIEASAETDLAKLQQLPFRHKYFLPTKAEPNPLSEQNQVKQISQSLASSNFTPGIESSMHMKGNVRLQTPPKSYNPVLLEQKKKQGRSIITINHNVDSAVQPSAEAKPQNSKFFFKKR
jgi:hypothetical protein